MKSRSGSFRAIDGTLVVCHLDFPGLPFVTVSDLDQSPDGPYIYLHAHVPDEQLGGEVWGIYRLSLLEEKWEDGEWFYQGHNEDGTLELDNRHATSLVTLSAETLSKMVAWARQGGVPLAGGKRTRLSALAGRQAA